MTKERLVDHATFLVVIAGNKYLHKRSNESSNADMATAYINFWFGMVFFKLRCYSEIRYTFERYK